MTISYAKGFLDAWMQMPALLAQTAEGRSDSGEGTTRWNVMRSLIDAELSRRRAGNAYSVKTGRLVEHVRDKDSDLWTELLLVIGGSAFSVGMALALYLTTSQTPVTVNVGGAR